MTAETAPPESAGQARPAAAPGRVRLVTRLRGWWWQVALVAAVAGLVVGGSVQHALDQRRQARDLYRIQVLSTLSRFLDEERAQAALPVSQRDAAVFGDLASSISDDLGVNGGGALNVTVAGASSATFTQVAVAVTVSSRYGDSTFAVYFVRGAAGLNAQNEGACLLSSSLLGSGRPKASLDLGGGYAEAPCPASLWSAAVTDPMAPHLNLTPITRP